VNLMFNTNNFKECNKGYTLVELMVALAVSAIVVAGTLAGYSVFAKQYEVINTRIDIDRQALKIIDLIQSDVMKAGFKSYKSANTMKSSDALVQRGLTDFSIVYDHIDSAGIPDRKLVRYSLGPGYVSSDGGEGRKKLYRDLRDCTSPASGCDLTTSTSDYSAGGQGEVIMDKIYAFEVTFLNTKSSGSFSGASQMVKINMTIAASRKVQGAPGWITKNYKFISRAKNVSLLN